MDSSTHVDIVGDDEYLIREVCNPNHLDSDGNIQEAAINVRDLRCRGASVHRRNHTPIEVVKASVRDRCDHSDRRRRHWQELVALLKTEKLRAIRLEESGAFCIKSEPLDNNPGHASIYFNRKENRKIKESDAREIRRSLTQLLQGPMTVEEAFQKS